MVAVVGCMRRVAQAVAGIDRRESQTRSIRRGVAGRRARNMVKDSCGRWRAHAAGCYDIIVLRGGGACLLVIKADDRYSAGGARACVAIEGWTKGCLADWVGGRQMAQARAKDRSLRYTRCKQRVARAEKMGDDVW